LFGVSIRSSRPLPLKPFVLKTKDGYLLGLAPEPQKGSPCAGCTEFWLRDRKVLAKRLELSDLLVRRDLIPELLAENSPHVFYEISEDGSATRLDALVFPHPACECDKLNYFPPHEVSKKTNFAFSPIYQLKVTRFGTPDGNLWLASATGETPITKIPVTTYGVERDKDVARFKAVDEWMKKVTAMDLPRRLEGGETLASEVLQSGQIELLSKNNFKNSPLDVMGVGKDKDEATVDALIALTRMRTLKRYASHMKNPMLVVGANNWVRTKVPFFLIQQYDLHLLFYPNSTQAWVVGMVAFSRHNTSEKPIFVFGADSEIGRALDQLFFKILEVLRPSEDEIFSNRTGEAQEQNPKLGMWWTHWIYRCPKISLKDVLHLEPYSRSIENWRDYFRDGQDTVSIVSVNNETMPSQVRTLVRLNVTEKEQQVASNVNGIGIWRDFMNSLA
jgi:hypothetical protein